MRSVGRGQGVRSGGTCPVAEAQPEHHGAAQPVAGAQPAGHPVDESGEHRVEFVGGAALLAECALGADRAATPADP